MSVADPVPRKKIIAATYGWLATPYRHRAHYKGAGADCLGLLLGVFEEVYGALPEMPPPYTADWGEITAPTSIKPEPLLDAAQRHLSPQPPNVMLPADVLLFRMHPDAPVKHAAILVEENKFIHAYSGRGVCLSTFGAWWRARLAAVFAFPSL